MAYALRYYKEIAQTDGGVVRLEIHKKDSTTSAVEIGAVVQGLSLEIQGQQDDIDTPIQKTSLHMTFVDASDIENGQKNGFWEEFYTPDALLWRVILKAKDAGETSFRTIWGGYVTPDSFSEDLVYRGSVSITARDNIGHMQDFPFDALGDADGLISLYNLVMGGWEKIQSPMDLLWNGLDWLSCNDVIAYHTLMNVSQFKDMNWYKAIETALASYGAVMRYAGENEVYVTTLRYMPSLGRNIDLMDRIDPVFIAGAQRELVPAVKRIEESVDYELESAPQPLVKASDFSGNTHVLDNTNELYGYSLTNTQEGEGWFNSIDYAAIYFSPSRYIIEDAENEDVESKMYVVAGVGYNNRAEYSRTILAQDITINITFGTGLMRKRFTDASGRPSGGYYLVPRLGTIFGISYAVYVIQNGVKMYYHFASGEWKAQASYRTETNESGITEINIPVDLSEYSGSVILGFDFGGIDATIPYVNIASVNFSGASELREKNTVNTIYNADNNVILSRDPELGPAFDKVALPAFIKNGIFYRNADGEILPARLWSWGGSEQQMAVWNHLQLLCYYAKPNNLISGTIVNADITRVAAIYEWGHAEHILVSGRYNFLNGHIEGAVLREFARYEDMWSEVAGAGMPETEQDSRSNVEGGASSSASPSTYTATQNVNIGTGGGGGGASYLGDLQDVDIEGVVAQSVLYYNGTSWVDMSLATLVNPLLNPYLKASDAEATYATLTALNNLASRVKAEEDITATYKSWWDDVMSLVVKDGDNIKIKTNLIVSGDTSSTAKGTDAGVAGTLLGIVFNGTKYDEPVNGILTIPNTYYTTEQVDDLIARVDVSSQLAGYQPLITASKKLDYSLLANTPTIPTSLPASDVYPWAKKSSLALADVPDLSSKYLPKSGGTISSSSNPALTIKRNNGRYDATIGFENSGDGLLGYIGISGSAGTGVIRPFYYNGTNAYDLIHSGNIGSYAPQFSTNILLSSSSNLVGYTYETGGDTKFPESGPAMVIGSANGAYKMAFHSRRGVLRFNSMENSALTGWKTIAFTDSNVASATKLATARTIWGQSFDGTGNVLATSGVGLISSNSYYGLSILPTGSPYYGVRTFLTYDQGSVMGAYEIAARHNYGLTISHGGGVAYDFENIPSNLSYTTLVNIRPNGNVGIGTTNPAYKLDVNGSASFGEGGARVVVSHLGNTIDSYVNGSFSGKLHLNTISSGNIQMCMGGGNVLIGTSTDSGYKLDVAGDIRSIASSAATRQLVAENTNASLGVGVNASGESFIYTAQSKPIKFYTSGTERMIIAAGGDVTIAKNLIIAGDMSSTSDMRLKQRIDDVTLDLKTMAEMPIFTFRWKDGRDYRLHLGSSAQYWEKPAPWLVMEDSFKTLNYAVLGVAGVKALAVTAVDHETRIKMLERKVSELETENRRLRYGN